MTELEKMLFIKARLLEGNTKEQAKRAYNKQAQLEKLYGKVQFTVAITSRGTGHCPYYI